jgi:hypothetical protein
MLLPLSCCPVRGFHCLAHWDNRLRPLILPVVATVHLVLTAMLLGTHRRHPRRMDLARPPGKVVLLCISLLFAVCSMR